MKLVKMSLKAYEKPGKDGSGENEMGVYVVMINPAELSISKSINRSSGEQRHGKQENSSFGSVAAATLSFKLDFDGTGLLGSPIPVQEAINNFEGIVYNVQTETHQTNFLEIKWGDSFFFRGYLTSLSINYTLFDAAGNALRANVSVSFEEYIPPTKEERDPGQASPDRTHLRFPNESDTLAKFCDHIYGDSKYMIQVARFNQLVNFRKLKLGQRLEFPPLINQN